MKMRQPPPSTKVLLDALEHVSQGYNREFSLKEFNLEYLG